MIKIIQLIEKQLPKCSPAEEKVANYILNNPKDIIEMSTKNLAELAHSSEASIIRLCKRIGIDSFKKLKKELSIELLHNNETSTISHSLKSNTIDTIIEQNILALQKTKNIIDIDSVQKAAQLIKESKKICFYGASESSLVAMDAYYKLIRININALFSQDSHISMVFASNMNENDLLFLISTSGKTKEVLELIEVAKKRNIKIILLTQSRKSPAIKDADVVLYTSKEEQNLRIGTMTTRITQLMIIDVLYTTICNDLGTNAINYIIDTHNTVQKAKRTT